MPHTPDKHAHTPADTIARYDAEARDESRSDEDRVDARATADMLRALLASEPRRRFLANRRALLGW